MLLFASCAAVSALHLDKNWLQGLGRGIGQADAPPSLFSYPPFPQCMENITVRRGWDLNGCIIS